MPEETDRSLDGEAIIAAFNAAGVEYIIVGGFAAEMYHAPVPPTQDIDFTPGTDPANLGRLAKALRVLGARLRTPGDQGGIAFDPAPELLASMRVLNLTCQFGPFDLTFTPDGTAGFHDLARRAITVVIGHEEARVAHLGDVIRSKRAAGRPKDLAVLPALELFASGRGIEVPSSIADDRARPPRPTSRGS